MNQHYAATSGIPEELLVLPPGAIRSCHLIRSGLDCQIPLSQAAWRLQSEQSGSKVRFARQNLTSTARNQQAYTFLNSTSKEAFEWPCQFLAPRRSLNIRD